MTDFSPLLKESDAAADPAKILNAGSNVFLLWQVHTPDINSQKKVSDVSQIVKMPSERTR